MKDIDIVEALAAMDPQAAAEFLSPALSHVLGLFDDEGKTDFLLGLFGPSAQDKTASMVHLWLAECLGEGVDPTKMCQSLVAKVAQSEQLQAVAAPEVLGLFEDWMEELEREVADLAASGSSVDPLDLADSLGLSRSGAQFMLSKLKQEGKLWAAGRAV